MNAPVDPALDPRLARAEAAASDPRIRRFLVVFIGRAGIGLIGALAFGIVLVLAQLAPGAHVGGLPLAALLGVAFAVIGVGMAVHPRIRRAAERWTERSLDELTTPPADPRDR